MSDAAEGIADPSPTALAAKSFMDRIDNPAHLWLIESRAVMGGWTGACEEGYWDTRVSDSIAKAAAYAVIALFREWAAECDEPLGASPPRCHP